MDEEESVLKVLDHKSESGNEEKHYSKRNHNANLLSGKQNFVGTLRRQVYIGSRLLPRSLMTDRLEYHCRDGNDTSNTPEMSRKFTQS